MANKTETAAKLAKKGIALYQQKQYEEAITELEVSLNFHCKYFEIILSIQ